MVETLARDFNEAERTELTRIIRTNIPFTVLQKIFPLTEAVKDKAEAYTIMFRILNTCRNLTSKTETKDKLNLILDANEDIYNDIYRYLSLVNESNEFRRYTYIKKISNIFIDKEKRKTLNALIDIFIVLSEKTPLMDIDKVAGLDMEADEGKEAYKDITTTLEGGGEFQE